jgi:hypothetical protein
MMTPQSIIGSILAHWPASTFKFEGSADHVHEGLENKSSMQAKSQINVEAEYSNLDISATTILYSTVQNFGVQNPTI